MGIFSGKDTVRGEVRDPKSVMFDRRGNGNVRDTDNPGGARHAAKLGPHREAANDLRPASDRAGKHRAE